MLIRVLNKEGIGRFARFIESYDPEFPEKAPFELLVNPKMSLDLGDVEIEIERREFTNKFEAGKYFHDLFNGNEPPNVDANTGLWSWLALFFFDELCPKGTRPGETARWVLMQDVWIRYYRHLLATPYRIYKFNADHIDRVMALLGGRVDRPGELMAQFASRKDIITNRPLLEAINTLYWDAGRQAIRRGAGGKGSGSARNLASMLNEFELTWDFASMTPEGIIELLPAQFDRFRKSPKPGKPKPPKTKSSGGISWFRGRK